MKQTPSDTARTACPPAAPPSWRRLWQVPVFVLGVAALLAAWLWPASGAQPVPLAQQHLQSALNLLDAGRGPEALEMAQAALAADGMASAQAGDIRFALGTAYLFSAGKLRDIDSTTAYRRARADLELAQQLSVAPSLQGPLLLRLAQARRQTGANLPSVAPLLQQCAQQDPTCAEEAYTLLVDLLQRHQPPQLNAALLATEKWLLVPVLRQPNLARLRRSELLLLLERREEARQTLQRIPEAATEFAPARLLLARSYQEEGAYSQAAELWQQALQTGQPPEALLQVRLMLGLCHASLNQRSQAEHAWQPLLEVHPRVPEALPAWLRLAEMRLAAQEINGALIAFDEALRDPKELASNPYLELLQVRKRIDLAWQQWRQTGHWTAAKRLMELSRTVFPAETAEERIGLTAEEAGQHYLSQAGKEVGAKAEGLIQQARFEFRNAGEAFSRAAQLKSHAQERTDLLWKSAQNLLRGQSYARAAVVLETYLTRELSPQRRAEALVGLGEALQAVRESEKAAQLLTQALRQPHALEQRARYLLALAYIDQKKYPEAEAVLRAVATSRNLNQEVPELAQSRFAIGHVLLLQEQYAEAVSAFEAALQQYPNDPQAMSARFRLAEACLHAGRQQVQHYKEAKQEATRDYYRQQRRHYYDRALNYFQGLAQDLSDRHEQSSLASTEAALLRSSRFGMGDCLFQQGRAQEAASVYESLALHHNHEAAGLTALMHLTQCHLHLQHAEEARLTLDRTERLLGQLSDTDLAVTQMTRSQWTDWLTWARKAGAETTP